MPSPACARRWARTPATCSSGSATTSASGSSSSGPGPVGAARACPRTPAPCCTSRGEAGYDFSLLAGAIASNDEQLSRVVAKVETACGGSADGATIGVWGLTFKANTDDRRDSPSLQIAHRLAGLGATVQAFDPTVDAETDVPDLHDLHLRADPYEAVAGAGSWWCSPNGTSSAGSTSPACSRPWPSPTSSTPATCSTPPPSAVWASRTRGSGASEPGRRRRRRRLPGLAPVRPAGRAGRHRRLPRRPLHRLAGQRRPPPR